METIRVGQLIERLSKLDKHDKVYCGGSPIADGPEPVASKGCMDLDPGHASAVSTLGGDFQSQYIKEIETQIETIRQSVREALDNLDAGEVFEATYTLRKLING